MGRLMGLEETHDQTLQAVAAANTQRLCRDLVQEQPIPGTSHVQPLATLEPAIAALRDLAELLKKESEKR